MHNHNRTNSIFTAGRALPETLLPTLSQEEALSIFKNDPDAFNLFRRLTAPQQQELLEYCMGNRGLKITYDPFFQHIFGPSMNPAPLRRFLSSILGQEVTIREVMNREGLRITEQSSLVIMDIVVALMDGTIVNVEIQKHGYYFPLQRSFCYGADLLVRQYTKLKEQQERRFNYTLLRPVYVIVLMENSSYEFKAYPNRYIHRSNFTFDTGLHLDNLLNFIYVPLDIFREMSHNEFEELEAWLYFLSSDNPVHVHKVIEKYPFFKELYQKIINFRYRPKELIAMYSEALSILDRNTVNYMIEDMQNQLEQARESLAEKEATLEALNASLAERQAAIAQKEVTLAEKDASLAEKDASLAEKDASLAEKDASLAEKDASLAEKDAEIARLKALLQAQDN